MLVHSAQKKEHFLVRWKTALVRTYVNTVTGEFSCLSTPYPALLLVTTNHNSTYTLLCNFLVNGLRYYPQTLISPLEMT